MKRRKTFWLIGLCVGFLGMMNVSALDNLYTLGQRSLTNFQMYNTEATNITSEKYLINTGEVNYIDTKGDTDIETILANINKTEGYSISVMNNSEAVTEGTLGAGYVLRVVSDTDETDTRDYSIGFLSLGTLSVVDDSKIDLAEVKKVSDITGELSVEGFTISTIKVLRQTTEETELAADDEIIGGDRLLVTFAEGFEKEYLLIYAGTSITIDQTNMDLAIDEEANLTATIQKVNENSVVQWESSNPGIVEVDATGKILTKQSGKATITATLEGKSDFIEINVSLVRPTIQSILGNSSSVQIQILEEGGATGYEIYRRLDSTGEGIASGTDFELIADIETSKYTDTNVQVGYTYTYKLRSYFTETDSTKTYSEYSDEAVVTISSLKIADIGRELKAGDSVQLTTNAEENETVTWSSSNVTIADVSETGLLTIKVPGDVNITAETATRQDTISLSIKLDTPTLSATLKNNTVELAVSNIIGANQYHIYRKADTEIDYTEIYQGSSNTYIDQDIELGKNYEYKAKAAYDNGFYYTIDSEESLSHSINVPEIDINQKTINLKVNEKATLDVSTSGFPSEATITWVSSNEEIATVDGNGVVTAKRPGDVKIVATAGGVSASTDVSITMTKPTISLSSTYNQVTLKATAVPGANGYDVYRATNANGPFVKQSAPTSLTYKNSVNTGTTYYYYIIAYYKGSSGTVYSEKSDVKTIVPAMTKPVVKTYAWGYQTIKIVTGKVAGATGYDIYRAASLNGVYTKLKTPTSLTYYDKSKVTSKYNVNAGQTYYYKIIAYRTVNGKRVYSPTTIVTGKTVPAKTTVSLSRYNSKTIRVKWTKVEGASGYEVYRALSKNGKYTKVKTVTKGSTVSYNDGKRMKGRRYYYKVRAYRTVNGKRVYGSFNNIPSYVLK